MAKKKKSNRGITNRESALNTVITTFLFFVRVLSDEEGNWK